LGCFCLVAVSNDLRRSLYLPPFETVSMVAGHGRPGVMKSLKKIHKLREFYLLLSLMGEVKK